MSDSITADKRLCEQRFGGSSPWNNVEAMTSCGTIWASHSNPGIWIKDA